MNCKVCSHCKKRKPFADFNKRVASKDGLQYRCRKCQYNLTLEWKRKNREKNYALDRKWVLKNRDLVNSYCRRHYKKNTEKELLRSSLKRAAKIKATPPWLSKEHTSQIKEFYWLVKDLQMVSGETYHVDHIVPLKGENVCGLHVPWNLQVLPADINLSKGNSYADYA